MCAHTPTLSDLIFFLREHSFKAVKQLKRAHLFNFPSRACTQASGKNLKSLFCLQQHSVIPQLVLSLPLPSVWLESHHFVSQWPHLLLWKTSCISMDSQVSLKKSQSRGGQTSLTPRQNRAVYWPLSPSSVVSQLSGALSSSASTLGTEERSQQRPGFTTAPVCWAQLGNDQAPRSPPLAGPAPAFIR